MAFEHFYAYQLEDYGAFLSVLFRTNDSFLYTPPESLNKLSGDFFPPGSEQVYVITTGLISQIIKGQNDDKKFKNVLR